MQEDNVKILIVENNRELSSLLRMYLVGSHFEVSESSESDAAKIAASENPDCFIMGLKPGIRDNMNMIRSIRKQTFAPIVIISGHEDDEEQILALNNGADDYIKKPFNPLIAVSRVNAAVRRYRKWNLYDEQADEQNEIRVGDLVLDNESLVLFKNGEAIHLTINEFKIIRLLMRHPGEIFTKSDICRAVNGTLYENYENAIMVHISHLRDKIEDDSREPKYIRNVRGLGYKISA
jgi:DNA-binding response OmpR family regulator